MDQLVEYWIPIAIFIGTLLGAMLTPLVGYMKKPRNGTAMMHGATMIDSSVAEDIAAALHRVAACLERLEHQLKETADSAAEDRKIRAAVEAARVKWEQEHRG